MKFEMLHERIKNPIRKQSIPDSWNKSNLDLEQTKREWKEYIIYGKMVDDHDTTIKANYLKLKKMFPQRAESWLDQQSDIESRKILGFRLKIENPIKIYSKQGIDVFIDKYTTINFTKDEQKMLQVKRSVDTMLEYIRGIIPNKKPRIVITDGSKNPYFVKVDGVNSAAIYIDRMIFIDEDEIDKPKYFVHEFAHYVADLIPTQSEAMLEKAYKQMLDMYWKSAKVKKRKLEADDPKNREQVLEAERWRRTISTKLGFPEYGLRNFHEFFAVLIENWRNLPANSVTYKFKTLVKDLLGRL